MGIGSGVEAGQRLKYTGIETSPSFWNAAHTLPIDRFKQILYQKCRFKVGVFWYISKLEFENFAPEKPLLQKTIIRVNCLVIINRNLGLEIVAKA